MPILPILLAALIGGRAADPPPDPAPEPAVPASRIRPESPGPGGSGQPSVPACAVLPDGSVLLVWESRSDGGRPDILFSRREPGPDGLWLREPLRLDADPPGASRSLEPRVAAGARGTVHVAWQDARDGQDDIRTRRSTDGGRTWDPEIRVDGDPPGAAVSSMPALAADGTGRVYLAWEDQRNGDRDIYFARSTDGGRTFEPDVRVDADDPGAGVSYHPELLCWDDGTVLVFWRDERDGLADVYVRRSPDGGTTWRPEARLDHRTRGIPDAGEPGASAGMHLGVAAREGGGWAAVWDEGGREVVGVQSVSAGRDTWTSFHVAKDWRSGVLPEDALRAAAVGRGVIPAAALTGGPVLWAGTAGDRIWHAIRSETGLRVACGDVSAHDIVLDGGDGAAGTPAPPAGITGAGLPDGGVFLAWVLDTGSGARLETVTIPGDAR